MQKINSVFVLSRSLAVRAVPGLVNLFTLVFVANVVSASTYGYFSTTVASAGLIANLVFGAISLTIVTQYAEMRRRGILSRYLATIFAVYAVFSLICITLVIVAKSFYSNPIYLSENILLFVLISSLHGILQELLRGKQIILAYGASDLLQALSFFAIIWLSVDAASSSDLLVGAFALSYAPAIFLNLVALKDDLRLQQPRLSIAREVIGIGRWLVLGTLAENLLYLGTRYLILWSNGAAALGIFSLSVDMAQRTVGFIVNAASFVYVPRAFAARAQDGDKAFRKVLREGAFVGGGAALSVAALISIASLIPLSKMIVPADFGTSAFLIISLAAIVNRMKKISFDQILISNSAPHWIFFINLTCSTAGLLVIHALSILDVFYAPYFGYLFGYCLAWAMSFYACRRGGGKGR